MPPAVSAAAARTPGVKSQAHHAREEIVLRLFHLAIPWALWVAVIIQAVVLRLAFPGAGTAACVAVAGAGLAWLDHHLRAHRAAFLGRWIGPATILAVAGWPRWRRSRWPGGAGRCCSRTWSAGCPGA